MGNRFPVDDFFRLKTDYLKLKSALHDDNTDLVSYHAHFNRLRSSFEHTERLGVLVAGVQPMAGIESVYGWQVFDDVLRRAAQTLDGLRGSALPEGALVALDGVAGERFVVFLASDADGRDIGLPALAAAAAAVADRLHEVFQGEAYRAMVPRPRFEVGYSLLTDDPFYRFERLVYRAVERARSQGATQRERVLQRGQAELQRILQEGDIEVMFQPIHALDGGGILGFEALCRGPSDGPFREPRAMFEASVQFGLGVELDALCHRRALQAASRLAHGHKLFLNALPAALLEPSSGEFLPMEWLERAGLNRSDIVIEVTERGPLEDRQRLGAELQALRASGLELSLDDIGTGLTGLRAIEDLRPDYLKLDVSLVHNIQSNLITQELLRSLTAVARTIDARVVGEGVETEAEVETLRSCGTEFGQGFLFARPAHGLTS